VTGSGPGAHGGAIHQSRKGSVAAEGTSALSTVWPFARLHPRRVLAGRSLPQVLQTCGGIAPVTRVPGAFTRRARAISQECANFAFSRALRPAQLPCPRKWKRSQAKAGVRSCRGSQALLRGDAWEDQRNWHRLVPASSGAKASLACEDRTARWVCSRVDTVAEVGERRPGSEKHDPRWQSGRVDGDQDSGKFRKGLTGIQRRR